MTAPTRYQIESGRQAVVDFNRQIVVIVARRGEWRTVRIVAGMDVGATLDLHYLELNVVDQPTIDNAVS